MIKKNAIIISLLISFVIIQKPSFAKTDIIFHCPKDNKGSKRFLSKCKIGSSNISKGQNTPLLNVKTGDKVTIIRKFGHKNIEGRIKEKENGEIDINWIKKSGHKSLKHYAKHKWVTSINAKIHNFINNTKKNIENKTIHINLFKEIKQKIPLSRETYQKLIKAILKAKIEHIVFYNIIFPKDMSYGFSLYHENITQDNVIYTSNLKSVKFVMCDLTKVTNMGAMFRGATSFNQDISKWNVSKITNMGSMFYNAKSFNQDISKWNVSKVTNMSWMFYDARSFNQDISKWNVSKVTNMSWMFYDARSFNQDISKWNVSKVTNMMGMFYDARSFNQDISKWNVSKVTNMGVMFGRAISFNQDISKWNVSKVTNMGGMFHEATSFNQDISKWNVSKVTFMRAMFYDATSFNQDISKWNVSKVAHMRDMFRGATSFNQDISKWDVSKVTNMLAKLEDHVQLSYKLQ